MRQLELLRDQLLSALADDPTLRPHDLLLLVPDAAAWAPYVDAVFGVTGDDTARIPYRIADRPLRRTQPAAEALARIIALEGGRLARTDVFGALSHPLVMQAAGLTEANVDNLDELTAMRQRAVGVRCRRSRHTRTARVRTGQLARRSLLAAAGCRHG